MPTPKRGAPQSGAWPPGWAAGASVAGVGASAVGVGVSPLGAEAVGVRVGAVSNARGATVSAATGVGRAAPLSVIT